MGFFREKRKWVLAAALLVLLIVTAPHFVRLYRVHGPSDAPNYLWGDVILVHRAAYDLQLPFSGVTILRTGSPRRGDVVLLRLPGDSYDVMRRVVGLPGDTIEVRASRVVLNGRVLDYEPARSSSFATVDARNKIGSVIEWERGGGPDRLITYTPDECGVATTAPQIVPQGRYFVLGDNRDHCKDSRRIGAVDRDWLRGKIWGTIWRPER